MPNIPSHKFWLSTYHDLFIFHFLFRLYKRIYTGWCACYSVEHAAIVNPSRNWWSFHILLTVSMCSNMYQCKYIGWWVCYNVGQVENAKTLLKAIDEKAWIILYRRLLLENRYKTEEPPSGITTHTVVLYNGMDYYVYGSTTLRK